ncbi:bile acid-sensitive ion channel-like [Convolutriloba macropyga]|uniref:bile acid-sensitive ion channel-like n=1 Tax=Convolutriloba macropyga TaxID=536237 RepID=UPI003F521BE3
MWSSVFTCMLFTPPDREVFGSWESLRLILIINSTDAAPFFGNSIGLLAAVVNAGSFSYFEDKTNKGLIPGYSYEIAVQKVTVEEQSGTTDCIPTGEKGHLVDILDDDGYSYAHCVYGCVEIAADRACGCIRPYSLFIDPFNPVACSAYQLLFCSHDEDKALAPCYRQCKPQCTNTYNEMTIKMTKFPSKQALTHGALIINQSRYSIEYLRKNSIELIVHFSSLTEVKVVRNLRFSFIDTIGAFGGLCGLMVGASLVTTFELVFCVTDIKNCINLDRNNRRRETSTPLESTPLETSTPFKVPPNVCVRP